MDFWAVYSFITGTKLTLVNKSIYMMELQLEFIFPSGNVKKPSAVRPTESGRFLQGTCLQGEFHHVHIACLSPLF